MKSGLVLADFGLDLRSSESGEATLNCFCQVSNARFPVNQISRNLNTTRRLMRRWIPSEKNFENFPVRGRFFNNAKFLAKKFQGLATSGGDNPATVIDRQKNHYHAIGPSTGYMVSIFTVGINLRSFPWPVGCVYGAYQYPKILYDVQRKPLMKLKTVWRVSRRGLMISSQ